MFILAVYQLKHQVLAPIFLAVKMQYGDGEAKPKISFPFLFPLRGGGCGIRTREGS